jgi:hypothetical protein
MKNKILLLTLNLVFVSISYAQTSFSCIYREYCIWNEYTEKFVNCEGYEEMSLFVVNKNETLFTHTIESMKSTYYVESSEYDSENEVFTYTTKSDVGNDYLYIFDPKNKEIRVLYVSDGKTMLIRFYVKAIF